MGLDRKDPEVKLGRAIARGLFDINGWLAFAINICAVIVSWYFNKSILWAILAYLLGWVYLLYSLLIGRFSNGGFLEIINSYL